ncbi:hypothetical protein Angca_007073, partial [Angiostrongylus cantonensis]
TKRAAWGAFKIIEDVVKRTKNTRLRANLFDVTVLPALTYASETWMAELRANLFDVTVLPALTYASETRSLREYTSRAKHRWAGHIMRRTDDRWTKRTVEWTPRECKRLLGRPPRRWA